MRYMVDTGDALLGISHCGDLVEWNPSMAGATAGAGVRKVYRSTTDLYRVDDFAYSESKGIVVVPYLGVKQDKTLSAPKNQVVLFKRDRDLKVIFLSFVAELSTHALDFVGSLSVDADSFEGRSAPFLRHHCYE